MNTSPTIPDGPRIAARASRSDRDLHELDPGAPVNGSDLAIYDTDDPQGGDPGAVEPGVLIYNRRRFAGARAALPAVRGPVRRDRRRSVTSSMRSSHRPAVAVRRRIVDGQNKIVRAHVPLKKNRRRLVRFALKSPFVRPSRRNVEDLGVRLPQRAEFKNGNETDRWW